jgi:hypothetical protein
MSFYQTTNASIVRFRTVPTKTVAPFDALQRVVQVQLVTGYTDGAAAILAPLTPEQLQNGVVIISPTAASVDTFALPSAYALQQYFGGRFAFNMAANQVNVGAGANQLNGNNDFFLINFYNLSTTAGVLVNSDNTQTKPITAATIANDAVMTPVLLRFSGVNSPLATINGVANAVTYTLF